MAKHRSCLLLLCLSLYLWLLLGTSNASSPPASVAVNDGSSLGIGRTSSSALRARRYPSVLTVRPRPDAIMRARQQVDPSDLLMYEDDALLELNKRQLSDDYGHMRFGKRAPAEFDDYGHMRFGRSNGGGGDSSD